MNILVLAGGLSPERDVSLSSGSLIANALASRGDAVLLADLYTGCDIPEGADPLSLFSSDVRYNAAVPESAPDLEALRAEYESVNRGSLFGRNILKLCHAADRVFIALHGACGENGQLQAALDMHGISYTGSGYLGAALAMDKDIAKRIAAADGIPTALSLKITRDTEPETILSKVGLPCVIKPCAGGSSVGVSIVRCEQELSAALDTGFAYEDSLLAERFVAGREFSLGVLDCKGLPKNVTPDMSLCTREGDLLALPAIEIIPRCGFYDYRNKYQSGLTEEITPADLTPEQSGRIQRLALTAHRSLRLGGYSRSDFILDEVTGDFVWLEANTLPGMTPTSLLPQEAAAAGISYVSLCETIVSGER